MKSEGKLTTRSSLRQTRADFLCCLDEVYGEILMDVMMLIDGQYVRVNGRFRCTQRTD